MDKPLHLQYVRYMSDLLKGDWGTSIRTHRPVSSDIRSFLPASLELILSGMFIAVLVGVPLGILSATRKETAPDHAARLISIGAVSIPTFWLAMLLQLIFFQHLGLFPLGSRLDTVVRLTYPVHKLTGSFLLDSLLTGNWPVFTNALSHIVLPAITMAAYPLGLITRMTRSSLLEVMNEEYIVVPRAYGIPRSVVYYRYALKNALGPTITVLGLTFAYSLAETFLVESVFNWPGLGQYASQAILSADYPAIMGVTMVVACVYVIVNLVVDLVLAWLDPRIRLEA
ncbi:MAG TPA: ABC transporter permease [Firmicutes bacterium]|nr:ABC transporter permease [Bacillota bacterium]